MTDMEATLADLRDEYDRLDRILAGLSDEGWRSPSDADGWSICDVVIHLAVTEEGVVSTLTEPSSEWSRRPGPLDDAVALDVERNQAEPDEVLARWRAATSASLAAMAAADPDQRFRWAAAPLRPRTLATTRLAEHWAHGLDITTPLGIDFPDTDRLRHIAWLGHATIPYGCSIRGIEPQPVRVELTGPQQQAWAFGPVDALSRIAGGAGAFCRVGALRLSPEESGLVVEGTFGETALSVLRNYAA